MGPEDSATRGILIDAVETIMCDMGYAAVSARKVAEVAGLKYQIVFYYFESMEDLLLAASRRRGQLWLERLEAALASDRPLHGLWDYSRDLFQSNLSLEYMAMSNHYPAIRKETQAYSEKAHNMMLARFNGLESIDIPGAPPLPPAVAATLVNLVGRIFGFEMALGLQHGHEAAQALVDWALGRVEPASNLVDARE